MKLQLDAVTQQWQKKARLFAEDELIPHEVEAEMNSGRLSRAVSQRHQEMAIELGFSSMDVPKRYGGLELRIVDQVGGLGTAGQGDKRTVLVFFGAA